MNANTIILPMKHKINAKVSFFHITDPNCIMEIRENYLNLFVPHIIDHNPHPVHISFLRDPPADLLSPRL